MELKEYREFVKENKVEKRYLDDLYQEACLAKLENRDIKKALEDWLIKFT